MDRWKREGGARKFIRDSERGSQETSVKYRKKLEDLPLFHRGPEISKREEEAQTEEEAARSLKKIRTREIFHGSREGRKRRKRGGGLQKRDTLLTTDVKREELNNTSEKLTARTEGNAEWINRSEARKWPP